MGTWYQWEATPLSFPLLSPVTRGLESVWDWELRRSNEMTCLLSAPGPRSSEKTISKLSPGKWHRQSLTTDNTTQNCGIFNAFKLNSSKMCGVRGQKRFSVLAQRKRFTLWKWVISEAIGGELYRSDSPVSTNTIQGINNGSAKSTTKSEPDKEPQWPGCDAKWNSL